MERNESKREGEREVERNESKREVERQRKYRGMERGKETKAERNRKEDKEREEPWHRRWLSSSQSPGCSCPPAPGKHHSLPFPHLETTEGHSFLCPSQVTQQRAPESHPYLSVHFLPKPQFPQCKISIVCMGGATGVQLCPPKHFSHRAGGTFVSAPTPPQSPLSELRSPHRYPSNSDCDYGSQLGEGRLLAGGAVDEFELPSVIHHRAGR